MTDLERLLDYMGYLAIGIVAALVGFFVVTEILNPALSVLTLDF